MDWRCSKKGSGKRVKQILESKLERSRKREDIDCGGWKMWRRIGWKWRQMAVHREECASVIKEAKVLRGPRAKE